MAIYVPLQEIQQAESYKADSPVLILAAEQLLFLWFSLPLTDPPTFLVKRRRAWWTSK
jgi:hypothetical protein